MVETPHKKIYVLDTNVLVYDPLALFSFENTHIGIPVTVLEELDRFKTESTDRGHNTRAVIRSLDSLRSRGSLGTGVTLDNGTTVRVLFVPDASLTLKMPFEINYADNAILLTALALKEEGYEVVFISKDINARVKADVLGITAQDYIKDDVSLEHFYQGWITLDVPSVQLKKDVPDGLVEAITEYKLVRNQYILVTSRNNQFNYRVYRYLGGRNFRLVSSPHLRWPIEPRNPQQLMALDALFDPSINLVTLLGPAGTGKTFLALLAGLHQVLIEDHFTRMLVSRPVIPLGPDIGYLPGTIEEKLHSWMQPIYDNMDFINHVAGRFHVDQDEDQQQYSGKRNERNRKEKHKSGQDREKRLAPLDIMIREGKVSLEAITYMRGRSIPYQYILIDEVQNLTPHEVKTLISRVGEGSKIILAGDPYQIDSPYLDFSSNGLMVATSKFKGQEIFASVFLQSSERSLLSKLASELL